MNDEKTLLVKILVLTVIFAFSACQKSETENINASVSPTVSPIQVFSPTPSPNLDSPIRKIDFENFTFPWTEGLSSKDEKNFTLKNGELPSDKDTIGVSFANTEYGDITGDKQEEAIVILGVHTGGSAMPNIVYVYTLKNENPKLLWSFDTGDRAEGGLNKIYAEDGKLIVELFGIDKFIESKNNFDFSSEKEIKNGLCCPTNFTRFRFKWNGKKFTVEGKPELFDYDWKRPNNEIR